MRLLVPRLAAVRLQPRTVSPALRRWNSTATSKTQQRESESFFTPAPGDNKPFMVTTPIFYVNASPHIGHLHSMVLTDTFARFSALRHPDRPVLFSTGTDEHGMKIQQAAAKGGMSEKEFCDKVSQRFRNLADKADTGYTDFVRTSEERHYAAVDAFWARLMASGSVYKGTHEGWYSVSDECFYSEQQIEKTDDGKMIATETGNEVVWSEEENWKFRLGDYKEQLREWLKRDEAVHPWPMHANIARQVDGMGELSISRPASRVKWGVPVPGDPSQTIYVWVDALINYLTVAGFPGEMPAWPADMHVVGKDIIRFHALHWPALLSAAKLPLPKRVLAHAHWTMGNAKMSKSRGNVVDPIAAMDHYGPDAVRWYLMRSGGSLEGDSDYSAGELSKAHAKLGAQLGNLVQRILAPKLLGNVGDSFARNADMDATLSALPEAIEKRFEGYELTAAVGVLEAALADANRFFSDNEPWAKADTTREIAYAYATLRNVGILSRPIIPTKSEELLDRLGVPANERGWKDAQWDGQLDVKEMKRRLEEAGQKYKGTTLFPRIDDRVKVDRAAEKEKERQLKEFQRAQAKREKEKKKAERRAREAEKEK